MDLDINYLALLLWLKAETLPKGQPNIWFMYQPLFTSEHDMMSSAVVPILLYSWLMSITVVYF